MSRVVIGLVALYAALFAFPRWGWTSVLAVVVGAFALSWLIDSHLRSAERERESERKRRLAEQIKTDSQVFTRSGCKFFGLGEAISVFEHQFDACGFDLIDKNCRVIATVKRIVRFEGGFVLAINTKGCWPQHYDDRALSGLLTRLKHDWPEAAGGRKFERVPTSPEADRWDDDRRQEVLRQIEAKVAARTASFESRRASDVGLGATAVYVISAAGRNACKVGISAIPEARRGSLQTGNSQKLSVHQAFWLRSRTDAKLLEDATHRRLETKGFIGIGEWFDVEPEIAARFVKETYSALLKERRIVEQSASATEASTYDELMLAVTDRVPWRLSKRGNLVTSWLGRKVTVYRQAGKWRYVIDGQFSDRSFESPDIAQVACLRALSIPRDEALAFLADQFKSRPEMKAQPG